MAPKAKKPSKAELAAEAERLAEAQLIADGIEVRRQEELRIQREAEAAAEAERLRVLEEEHLARVAAEDETQLPSYATAAAELRKERAAFDADKLWRRYMTETMLPDPADQPDVHSYFYAWEARPSSADFDETLDGLRDAAALRAELLAESRLAMEQGDLVKASWQRSLVGELDALVASKLDAGTAAFLSAAQTLPDAGTGDVSREGGRDSPFRVGLWLNLTKNPRTKTVSFPSLGFSTEIPKTLALGSIALRAVHSYVDTFTVPFTPTESPPPLPPSDQSEGGEGGGAEVAGVEGETAGEQGAVEQVAVEQVAVGEEGAADKHGVETGGEGEGEAAAAAANSEAAGEDGAAGEGKGGEEGGEGAAESGGPAIAAQVEEDLPPEPEVPMPVSWLTVGGVVTIDILTLPPSGSSAKGWSLREVTKLEAEVDRQTYPVAEQALTAAPLKVTFTLPPHVIPPPTGTLSAPGHAVAFFDPGLQTWTTDGVTDAEFDQQTLAVSAYMPRLTCTVALVVPRHRELPYAQWLIVPAGPASCALLLHTANRQLEIRISAAGVVLVPPQAGEAGGEEGCAQGDVLGALSGCGPCPPSVLFSRLREAGLFLCPCDHDAIPLNHGEAIVTRHVVPKNETFEKELHAEIPKLVAAGLKLTSSKHTQRLCPASALLRLAAIPPAEEVLDDEAPPPQPDPWSLVHEHWACLAVSKTGPTGNPIDRYATLIKGTESAASATTLDMSPPDGATSHSTPILCIQAEGQEKYPNLGQFKSSPKLYQDTLRQVLDKLRLFSFTKM